MKIIPKFAQHTLACLLFGCALAATASAEHQSTSTAYWWWDNASPVGSTSLIRTPGGITAKFETTGLPAGHAMTLWIMAFNNPTECLTTPCTLADAGNPAVEFDFHYAGGHITNGAKSTITGYLRVGDVSGSGWAEVGVEPLVAALTNPIGAEVVLAIHSHGPALAGKDLASQISSYLGGCAEFLGPGGFAASATDIPALPGECSTIQSSLHLP